jgi:hypothetical protein
MRNTAIGILVFPRFQLLDLVGSGAHHHQMDAILARIDCSQVCFRHSFL